MPASCLKNQSNPNNGLLKLIYLKGSSLAHYCLLLSNLSLRIASSVGLFEQFCLYYRTLFPLETAGGVRSRRLTCAGLDESNLS